MSSGAQRAPQMLAILRHAAGQEFVAITVEPGPRSQVEPRWRAAAQAAGKGADLEQIRAGDPDLVKQETQLLGAALRRVLDGVPDSARVLVVGHSPTTEAAILGLT